MNWDDQVKHQHRTKLVHVLVVALVMGNHGPAALPRE
jgi:hypothetical protein